MTTKIKWNHKKYSIHKAEKGTKNKLRKKKTKSKMIDLNPTLSMITLIISGLDNLLERQSFPD